MKFLKTLVILLVIVAIFGGAMFALNLYTGPIIEENNAGAEFAPLLAVMPEGSVFDGEALLYSAENPAASSLKDVPASVLSVYKEANGLGYAIRCTGESNYSTAPMEITIGISADGKICGVQIDAYNDTASFDFRTKDPNYLSTYIGQDSSLSGVGLVAGSTYSSTAFKTAVSEAMGVLIANDLIAEGVKTDAQILTEMIPSLHTGLTSGGFLKGTAVEASGNITEGYKALNGTGYAFIMKNGEASLLAIVNAVGNCKLYDTTGADVTEANTALAEEAVAAATLQDFSADAQNMLTATYADATEITPLNFTTFGNVVYAASFVTGENTYYAFYSRPLTYEDSAMSICTVLDANGAIVSQDVKEFLFGHGVEYLPAYGSGYGDVGSDVFKGYEDQFDGITSGTVSDELLVSGATVSSTAVKLATQDVFAAFDSIQIGGEQE